MKTAWTRRSLLLVAGLAVGVTAGCDDGEDNPDASWSVGFVELPAALSCAADLDRTTDDVLEYDVIVDAKLVGVEREAYSVRLLALGTNGEALFPAINKAIPASGRVTFAAVPLPLGAVPLEVQLFEGETQVGSAQQTVTTAIDTADSACPAGPSLTLSVLKPEPATLFTAADDADGALGNQLQTEVIVGVEGPATGSVALTVDGDAVAQAAVVDGQATFADVALGVGDGSRQSHQIEATLGDASATVAVDVEVGDCALQVEPQIAGAACELLDTDPDAEGVQAELIAQTNCATVTFTINGEDAPAVPVVGNEARLTWTFLDGENTIGARAETASGVTGAIEPYTLRTVSDGPVITLDGLQDVGPNRFDLSDRVGEANVWAFSGTASNVPAGEALTLTWDPAREPGTALVGEDGGFTFEVPEEAFGCWTLTVGGTDVCQNEGASAPHEICIDAIQPALGISSPADGAIVHPGMDADLQADGLQIAVTVTVADPRPVDTYDYDVDVECTTNQIDWVSRGSVRRSDVAAGDATVIISILEGDVAGISCRANTAPNPNAALTEPATWQVAVDAPAFTIQEPAAQPNGAACAGDVVVVGGTGSGLDGSEPALAATLTREDGEVGPFALEGLGDEAYRVEIAAADVPEGAYVATVAGTVLGELPVLVAPADGVPVVVDRTDPVVSIEGLADGATLGLADDADADLGNCVQAPVTLRVADATATEVCYHVEGVGRARCVPLADGAAAVPAVDFLDGTNTLVVEATDCAGNAGSAQIEIETEGCPPRIVVESPADGARIAASTDVDAGTPGVQIDVTVSTGLAEGSEITVAVVDGEVFGPAVVGADGTATVRVTLTAPEGQVEPLAFGLQGRSQGANAGPISTVFVHYTAPAVAIRALGDCINRGVQDASPAAGFQVAVVADIERAQPGDAVTLAAVCGDVRSGVEGVVGVDGSVAFPPLTVPQEADCELTAEVTDGAGQTGRGIAQVAIDRAVPTVSFVQPVDASVLTPADDQDRRQVIEANGIQYTTLVRICGAAGRTVSIDTQPAIGGGHFEFEVGEGECSDVALPELTFPEGNLVFTGTVGDACGNIGQTVSVVDVQGGASVIIVDPDDQGTLRANIDDDELEPGCQYTLVATTFSLGVGAEYTVCTDFPQGDRPVLCNGRASALDPRGDGCQAQEGNLLRCPLSLSDGAHELTVVARFGERIESLPISVRADCSAPTVGSITVAEAGDDACVNRQERLNPDDPNATAAVNVQFTTDGIEDGQSVQIRSAAGGLLGSTRVQGDQGSARINLPTGETYGLYLDARDLAGNRLPGYAPGVNGVAVRVDTVSPNPSLLNLVPGGCLNAAADTDEMTPALQFAAQIDTGREPGEALDLALLAADRIDAAGVDTPQYTFEATPFAEGPGTVAITATDACGNVGSVGGFAQGAGRDDWARPLPIDFRVDTIAPSLSLGGLQAARVYTAGDDSDADPSNGFQLAVTADFDPIDSIEAGAEVRFFSGQSRLASTPAPLLIPAGFGGSIGGAVTLPPGPQAVSAQASDSCGNLGVSAPVNIQVDVGGCTSSLLGFEADSVLGAADGIVGGGGLSTTITGRVDLLDPQCANARVSLIVDGAAVAEQGVGGDGAVAFDAVVLPEGERTLALRVSLAGETNDSIVQAVLVDLTAPAVTLESPAGDPAVVFDDVGAEAGQQALLAARVTEPSVLSARTARVTIDGVDAGGAEVPAGSPALVNVTITLTPGEHVVALCVADAAGNEGCAEKTINADPAAPGAVVVTVNVTDARAPSVELVFTAPGDDGAEGVVDHYEIRRAAAAIADEQAWDNATVVEGDVAAVAPAGAEETLTVSALAINQLHHVAVRAVDETGRMSPVGSVEVDLRLHQVGFDLAARDGAWNDDSVLTDTGIIKSVGDVDGDGFDDLLVALSLAPTALSQAAVVFGRADPENAGPEDVLLLDVPDTVDAGYFGLSSGALRDVNGDGAPDFAVVGYAPGFPAVLESVVVVYFGCPAGDAGCDRAAVGAPDSAIQTGRLAYGVAGVGNANQRAIDGAETYGDILIGGSVFADSANAYLIAGRANWPAVLDASTLDLAEGRTEVRVPNGVVNGGTTGRQITYVGDLDGDGFDEVAFVDGTDYSHTFIYYGGEELPLSYGLDGDIRNTELAHPCRASGTTFGSFLAGGADLDGDPDGRPDLLVGDYQGKRIIAFDQDLASFECFGRSEVFFGLTFDIAGDFDGDGDIDIIANHQDDQGRAQDAFVFYNDGSGRFGEGDGVAPRAAQVLLRTPDRVKQGVAGVGDFDGNLSPDVAIGSVVAGPNGLSVVIYY